MRYKAGLETRDRILEATRGLIAEEGLEGTTIKAICDRAGVLPGSFYNLFSSKEEAILSVVRDAIDAVDPDPSHEGPDDIDALVDAYVTWPASISESRSPVHEMGTPKSRGACCGITKDE